MNPAPVQTIRDFLATTSVQIPLLWFVTNLFLAALLSFLLSQVYIRYADSISNREYFSRNFLLITMTTMLIISIVKSSLALSLGLVGALSIVRFRAAIKEPEELAYLFLAIGIGLGLGADQAIISVVAFILISLILISRKLFLKKVVDKQNLHLTVYSHNPHKIALEHVVDTLKKHCFAVELRRFDESEEVLEACFVIEVSNFKQLSIAKNALQEINNSLKITFLDNKGVI